MSSGFTWTWMQPFSGPEISGIAQSLGQLAGVAAEPKMPDSVLSSFRYSMPFKVSSKTLGSVSQAADAGDI